MEHEYPIDEDFVATGGVFSITDWENEPTISDLKQDIESATPMQKSQVSKINTWLDNLHVRGAAKQPASKTRSTITPQLIRKQAEWRYAALSEPFLSTDDLFNVSPVTFEDKVGAEQNSLVLNNQFNTKLGKVKFIDAFVRAVVNEGTAIVRVGWEYEEEINRRTVPVFEYSPQTDPALASQFVALYQASQDNPAILDQLPEDQRELFDMSVEYGQALQQVQVGTEEIDEVTVLRNQPTVELCDYRNILVDPLCGGDLSKAQFIAYSFDTSMSELEKAGKYTNLNKIKVSSASPLSEPDHESPVDDAFNFKDKPRTKMVAYEYWGFWDIDGTGTVKPIVATYVGDTLIRMEENPYPDKELPFVFVQYLPVKDSVYGEPDGALLVDNQKVIGAVTRGMIDILGRSANGQVGTRKDALDITNKRKFDKGLDYEFNTNVNPRDAFFMHTFPAIPASAEYMLNVQNAEAESLSGVKAFSGGITGQALGSTATGIRSALDATSKRELGILRRLADGIIAIGRKIISMNAEFLEEEEVVRITNDQFVRVRRDDLGGKFDLKLSISTAEADNEKAQELSFMLQTMGNSMDTSMSKMILADIAKLRKMPDLAKKIEAYQPQPDPLQQEKAALEVELLRAQIANETAKAKENEVDVVYKTAKTQTEMAKGRNLNSKSDKQDADFLDQVSGTKHQQDMEKKDHDRGTQLDLKTADALLSSTPGEEPPTQPVPGLQEI